MLPAPDLHDSLHVVCLCAAWCGVCREWEPVFRELAAAWPQARFSWVDVEDEDDAMGEVEVETFPTLLAARAGRVLFMGPVQPLATQVERLLSALHAQARPAPGVTPAVQHLFERLRAGPLARGTS